MIMLLSYKPATCHLMVCGFFVTAALVRVPSIGVSPVKDTQPVTPVSVTVQVCATSAAF